MTAKADGSRRGVRADGGVYREARQALRSLCPQALLNWREARFYGRYVHYLRRHARRMIAFEPMPSLADALRAKFRRDVEVQSIGPPDRAGSVELHMPVVDGITVTSWSTVSPTASATYPDHRAIEVPMATLDSVYEGEVGFIKIDVEGHEQAVLDGAVQTIRRCRPRILVEIDERQSPGGPARARAYFKDLDYHGYFVQAGHIEPMSLFSPDLLQNPADLPDLTAPLQQRQRFGRYIYNFILLP